MMRDEFEAYIGKSLTPEQYEKIELVYMEHPLFNSNTEAKLRISYYYLRHGMKGIEVLYREAKDIRELNDRIIKNQKILKVIAEAKGIGVNVVDIFKGLGSTVAFENSDEVAREYTDQIKRDEEALDLVMQEANCRSLMRADFTGMK